MAILAAAIPIGGHYNRSSNGPENLMTLYLPRTAILAAANPIGGHHNRSSDGPENLMTLSIYLGRRY